MRSSLRTSRFRPTLRLSLTRLFLFGEHFVQIGLGDAENFPQCVIKHRRVGETRLWVSHLRGYNTPRPAWEEPLLPSVCD
jgi:hypothetical protein